jgi:hypothetical protein
MKCVPIAIAAICAGLLAAGACRAAEFFVDRLSDTVDVTPGDGLCADPIDGGCSMRAALIEANALPGHDRIIVPEGVFMLARPGPDDDLSLSGDLDVLGPVDIIGSGSETTVLDAASLDRVFDLRSAGTGEIHLQGLTLRNGSMAGVQSPTDRINGIAVHVRPFVHVQLDDLILRNHRAVFEVQGSTAIANNNGCVAARHLRILDNRVSDQSAPLLHSGGIITTGVDSCMDLEDLEISGNDGGNAGAIFLDGGAQMTIRRALIADNRGGNIGAVLVNGGNTVRMENVTISGNRGAGAVMNDGNSTLRMFNCTVTGNRGWNGTPNVAGLADGHGKPSRIHLTNTIVAGNGPARFSNDCHAVTSIGGGNLIQDSRCMVTSLQLSDQLGVDAQLQDLADLGGFSPAHLPGFPALDRGADEHCPQVDQCGLARPQDGDGDGQAHCDIGAVEVPAAYFFRHGFED